MFQPNHPRQQAIIGVLSSFVSHINATSICMQAYKNGAHRSPNSRVAPDAVLLDDLSRGLAVFCRNPVVRDKCLQEIKQVLKSPLREAKLDPVIVVIRTEDDIVSARRASRTMAGELGFDETDLSKVTTAVSELARNIHRYARIGNIVLSPVHTPKLGIRVVAKDHGPGIPDASLILILGGRYKSKTGLGLGIVGCKRLADDFSIDTGLGRGTEITFTKYLRGT